MNRLAQYDSQAGDEGEQPFAAMRMTGPSGPRGGARSHTGDLALIEARAGYSAQGGGARALGLTVGLHILAIVALAGAGYSAIDRGPVKTLEVFNLEQPEVAPPPPPPQQELVVPDQVEVAVQKIVAPPTEIEMPSINPVQTTRKPRETPKVAAVVAETPSPSPSPAAEPAPVVPPNFNAAQLNNPAPSYPYLSKKAKEQGVVMLKVRVGTDGRAQSVNLHRSSGFDRLDDAALKTVKRWRFVAATQAGKPVEAWVLVPVTFALN